VFDQLLLYAIALSTRTGIHWKHIDCAWFDEKNYYKFKALDAYYKMKEKFIPPNKRRTYNKNRNRVPAPVLAAGK